MQGQDVGCSQHGQEQVVQGERCDLMTNTTFCYRVEHLFHDNRERTQEAKYRSLMLITFFYSVDCDPEWRHSGVTPQMEIHKLQ